MRKAVPTIVGALVVLTACNEVATGPDIDPSRDMTRSEVAMLPPDSQLSNTIDTDRDGLPDTEEEILLRQFRPHWYFDGQEFIFPISIAQWGLATGSISQGSSRIPYNNLYTLKNAALSLSRGVMKPTGFFIVGNREDDAPVYVDALPMPESFSVGGKNNLVWLHYYLFFGDDAKLILWPNGLRHRGDWEHICMLVERSAAGIRQRMPVKLHFHHHGDLDVSSTAYAWHADYWGYRHPRVYVEAGAHGMYRNPGRGPVGPHNSNAGSPDNPLDNPLRFMALHWSTRFGQARDEKDILQRFRGKWGDSGGSPKGPLQYNNSCDHDYVKSPRSFSFRLSDC